jgi:cell pole-organizing protein PopZ
MSGQGGPPPLDPSMEDILASIRRILNEDEQVPPPPAAEEPFPLTPEMIVTDAAPRQAEPPPATMPSEGSLVAPAVAAAAAATLGSLTRNVAPERGPQLRAGGPTIEELVREELRPMLKDWLDANLPALVERVVRSEIERVVTRAAG